jgi:hypothetical protein
MVNPSEFDALWCHSGRRAPDLQVSGVVLVAAIWHHDLGAHPPKLIHRGPAQEPRRAEHRRLGERVARVTWSAETRSSKVLLELAGKDSGSFRVLQ